MSKPRITMSPTVSLSVATDRKLRADARLSAYPTNALERRDDGLYVEDFKPVGAMIAYSADITGQAFPVFDRSVTPVASLLVYNAVLADSADMTDTADLTRVTCRRDGRYLVSSHGRFRSVGTWTTTVCFAWIAKNGDEMQPLAHHVGVFIGATDPAIATGSAPVPAGQSPDLLTGTYQCENVVDLVEGDYIDTRLLFVSGSSTPPANTMTTLTNSSTLGYTTQHLAMVQVGAP